MVFFLSVIDISLSFRLSRFCQPASDATSIYDHIFSCDQHPQSPDWASSVGSSQRRSIDRWRLAWCGVCLTRRTGGTDIPSPWEISVRLITWQSRVTLYHHLCAMPLNLCRQGWVGGSLVGTAINKGKEDPTDSVEWARRKQRGQ